MRVDCVLSATSASLIYISQVPFYKFNFIFHQNKFTLQLIYFSFNFVRKCIKPTRQRLYRFVETHDQLHELSCLVSISPQLQLVGAHVWHFWFLMAFQLLNTGQVIKGSSQLLCTLLVVLMPDNSHLSLIPERSIICQTVYRWILSLCTFSLLLTLTSRIPRCTRRCHLINHVLVLRLAHKISMLVLHDGNDFRAHDDFALAKAISKELLNRNLRFVAIEMGQQ